MKDQNHNKLMQFINQNFEKQSIETANQFILNSLLSVSFSKGHIYDSFICSGIFNVNPRISTKITLKNCEDLHIRCNCKSAYAPFCEHGAALLLHQYLNLSPDDSFKDQDFNDQILRFQTPGKIYTGPAKLNPLVNHKQFEQLKYQLLDSQVISFPEVYDNNKKLIFNFNKQNQNYQINFSCDLNIPLREQHYSIFADRYIFDWDSGQVFVLQEQIKLFLNLIKEFPEQMTEFQASNLLSFYAANEHSDAYNLSYNDNIFNEESAIEAKVFFNISKDKEDNKLHLEVGFEENKIPLKLPDFFLVPFISSSPFGYFVSKNESILFLQSFLKDIQSSTQYTYTFSNKEMIINQIESISGHSFVYWYDSIQNAYFKFSTQQLIETYQMLNLFYGIEPFVYSKRSNHCLEMYIKRDNLNKSIPDFVKECISKGINIYTQKNKISSFSPDIIVKRNQNEKNWLEYKIDINKEDLRFINEYANTDELTHIIEHGVLIDQSKVQQLAILNNHIKQSSVKSEDQINENEFQVRLSKCRLFELFELREFSEEIITTEEQQICNKLLELNKIPEYELPSNLKYEPRKYQVRGYNWIKFLYEFKFGACLADDMGLGKTFQTILFISSIIDQIDHVLIACPVSLIMNWKHEIEKFSDLEAYIHYGENREPNHDKKITITSYGLIRRDFDSTFKNKKFDVFIMDEVQFIKNSKSLGSNYAHAIEANFRLTLTGTPVENHIKEYLNIMDLSVPGLWGKVLPKISGSKIKNNLEYIRKCASPFILRRQKSKVLSDLPPKIEQNVFLNFSPEEKLFYNKTLEQIRNEMNASKMGFGVVLKSILTLRKLCLWQEAMMFNSTKLKFLADTLDQILDEGHSCLIYSQFTSYLDNIQRYFNQRKWTYSRVDGSMNMSKRNKEIEKFCNKKSNLFLISLKAGGIGLNLTQANYVFIMDPWWNPAVENQAIDRAHRIGQNKSVYIYRLLIKNSIEEKVLKLQEEKKELFDNLVNNSERNFESMSLDTLRNLVLT